MTDASFAGAAEDLRSRPRRPLPDRPAGAAFRIVPLQTLARGDRWRTEAMRSYRQPVLYWFTRGQGRLSVQGVTSGYGPHNVLLLPPATMHGFEVLGQVAGVLMHLPACADLTLPGQPLHLRLRDAQRQAEMTQQIDNIQREIDLGAEAMERALMHHAGLLSVWLQRQAGTAWEDEGADAERSQRAGDRLTRAYAALLERDFSNGRGVAHYAASLGVTATHLSRACKAASGRPASSLLHDRVVWEAQRLLRETGLPVQEVAAALGFRSAAYFTRAFHRHTGHTPTAFRRAVGSDGMRPN